MIVIIVIFGLIIGSFLNALIYRLKSGDKIVYSRSKCVHCKHVLGFKDLFPIFSFIVLKGKCRYCKKSISWQYPLVELATAVIFLLGYFHYLSPNFLNINLASYLVFLVFSSVLILVFVYDFKHYLILDQVTLPALIFAFVANFFLGTSLASLLLASLTVSGFFLFQFVVSKGKWIGGGDIRLGLVMGAMLGWPQAMVALLLAYVMGAVFSLALIIFKKKQWGDQLPFGTFLSLATLITLLYGQAILRWYLTEANIL